MFIVTVYFKLYVVPYYILYYILYNFKGDRLGYLPNHSGRCGRLGHLGGLLWHAFRQHDGQRDTTVHIRHVGRGVCPIQHATYNHYGLPPSGQRNGGDWRGCTTRWRTSFVPGVALPPGQTTCRGWCWAMASEPAPRRSLGTSAGEAALGHVQAAPGQLHADVWPAWDEKTTF